MGNPHCARLTGSRERTPPKSTVSWLIWNSRKDDSNSPETTQIGIGYQLITFALLSFWWKTDIKTLHLVSVPIGLFHAKRPSIRELEGQPINQTAVSTQQKMLRKPGTSQDLRLAPAYPLADPGWYQVLSLWMTMSNQLQAPVVFQTIFKAKDIVRDKQWLWHAMPSTWRLQNE